MFLKLDPVAHITEEIWESMKLRKVTFTNKVGLSTMQTYGQG